MKQSETRWELCEAASEEEMTEMRKHGGKMFLCMWNIRGTWGLSLCTLKQTSNINLISEWWISDREQRAKKRSRAEKWKCKVSRHEHRDREERRRAGNRRREEFILRAVWAGRPGWLPLGPHHLTLTPAWSWERILGKNVHQEGNYDHQATTLAPQSQEDSVVS